MNQRHATRCAHALVWSLIHDFDEDIVSGFTSDDRHRILTALDRIKTNHYRNSGPWIDPGLPWPQPLPNFDRFHERPGVQRTLA